MTDIYEKLRERLDMFPQGFPKTKSRVELKILKELFSLDLGSDQPKGLNSLLIL